MSDVLGVIVDHWSNIRFFIGSILCLAGASLCVIGTVGLLRFPDFFTRTHAASIIDTGGVGLLIIGMMFFPTASLLIIIKLVLMLLFIAITSPTGSHAIANAAYVAGVRPLIFSDQNDDEQSDSKEGMV